MVLFPRPTYKVLKREGLVVGPLIAFEYYGGLTKKGMDVARLVVEKEPKLVEKVKDKWEQPGWMEKGKEF